MRLRHLENVIKIKTVQRELNFQRLALGVLIGGVFCFLVKHSSGFKVYTRPCGVLAIAFSELAAGVVVLFLTPGKWAKVGSGDLADRVGGKYFSLGVHPPGLADSGGGAAGGQGELPWPRLHALGLHTC